MRSPTLALCLFALVSLPGPVSAFLPNPDMLTVSPAVATAGGSVEMSVTGNHLDGAKGLRFSHPKIEAKPVMQAADDFHPNPRAVDGRFTVTIPADVEPGVYEVRSLGYFGLSTARPFVVYPAGSAEMVEEGDHSAPETALPLGTGEGVLGTLVAGKFDWYRFTGREGERVLLEVLAERIDSRGDVLMAVFDANGRELENSRHHFGRDPFIDFTPPADGDYLVSLCDVLYGGGREFFYHLRLGRGPHVDFVFPPAGEPGERRSFTLFGRNLPDASLGGNWSLKGKPLETLEVALDVPVEESVAVSFHPGIPREAMMPAFDYSLEGANPVRIGFATAPVVEEEAGSDLQNVPVPAEIAGRFDEPGDIDRYRVALKEGTAYWIDVVSHRLGVLADPFVMVEKITRDETGEETFATVAENDDLPSFYGRDSLNDLNADSLDPGLVYTPDADGDYRITIINQTGGGSAAHLYRLAIREARHDFQLIVGTELTKTINNDAFPAAPLLRRGGSMVYRVIAFRRDGFEGDIAVVASGLPPGVAAAPLVLSGKTSEGFLAVWAAPDAAAWSGPITIAGSAKVGEGDEGDVVREARPASILWGKRVFGNQAQVRSRLDLETVLSVIETETEPTRVQPVEEKVWTVEMGQSLELPVKLTETGTRVGGLVVNVHGFPGLHRGPPTVTIGEKETEATLKIDFKASPSFEIAPGRYQFVLQGVGNAKYSQNPAAAESARAEAARLQELKSALAKEVEKGKSDLAEAEKVLAETEARESAAADDEARAALKAETDAARSRVDEAKQELARSEAKLERLAKVEEAAVTAASAAEAKSKERTNQFATYSLPVTVEVTPAPQETK